MASRVSASSRSKGRNVMASMKHKNKAGSSSRMVDSLPTKEEDDRCSVIRSLGCSRRVYLTKSYFTKDIWDLSNRLRILSKNTSINSILLGSTVPLTTDEEKQLQQHQDHFIYQFPEMVRQLERINSTHHHITYDTLPLAKNKEEWLLLHSGIDYDDKDESVLLDGIQHLALSMRGGKFEEDESRSKVPIISVLDGGLVNGGFALAMGSYALATRQASFRMTYPLYGLAMDPIGFSYMLPRLGPPVLKQYAETIGLLLSLCGYQANASDMVETGLATHYMESMGKLATLERALSELLPYEQQGILDTPIRTYPITTSNPMLEEEDINEEFRNVPVANLLHAIATYDTQGQELGNHWTDERDFHNKRYDDPSLYFGENIPTPLHQDRTSTLIDLASTLHPIFQEESSVQGIMDRFQQVIADCQTNISSANKQDAKEEQECMDLVQGLLQHMQSSSPLALRAIYRLHQVGKDSAETFQSCMSREKSVQLKLYQHSDYCTHKDNPTTWKHASVQDVTDDEVEELL